MDAKTLWGRINKLRKPCKPTEEMEITYQNVDISDTNDIAQICNNFFLDSVRELHRNRTIVSNVQFNYNNNITPSTSSLYLTPTTPDELEEIIKSLKGNNFKKSDIPTRLLKKIITPLAKILSPLINLCFEKCIFPKILKISEINPRYKKGNKKEVANQRPITKSNPVTKIFEIVLYTRLQCFFNKFELISNLQFGFQKGKSIEGAAINLLHEINEANASGVSTVSVFLDMSKAFDTINHALLLQKLELYGIRGPPLELIRSYFAERFQYTRVGNSKSDTLPVEMGVPQGSPLGPLFFAIYINDVVKVIRHVKIILYADDIALVDSHENPLTIKRNIEADLVNVTHYLHSNELFLNHEKTKWMLFTRSRSISMDILMGGLPIERVNEFTYLGLLIDSKLTFSNHILNLSKKVNKANGSLYFLKFKLPECLLMKLFHALVYPHMHLHILAWGGATQAALNPLVVSVNKTLRNICHHELNTADKFIHHNILSVPKLFQLKTVEFIYSAIKLNKSPLLVDIRPKIEFSHAYGTRRCRR